MKDEYELGQWEVGTVFKAEEQHAWGPGDKEAWNIQGTDFIPGPSSSSEKILVYPAHSPSKLWEFNLINVNKLKHVGIGPGHLGLNSSSAFY